MGKRIECVTYNDNSGGTDPNKQTQQSGLYGSAQHNERRQAQCGDGHHEAEDRTKLCAFAQQCLRNRYGAENIGIHRNADQSSQHHAEGIITAQCRLDPALGDPVVNDSANTHTIRIYGNTFLKVVMTCALE